MDDSRNVREIAAQILAEQAVEFPQMSPQASPRITPATLDFPDAMRKIKEGGHVTKLEWGNDRFFCGLNEARLRLHKPDGKWYDWIVSEGDMAGTDWVVYDPANYSATP